jgi:hypothetical protein
MFHLDGVKWSGRARLLANSLAEFVDCKPQTYIVRTKAVVKYGSSSYFVGVVVPRLVFDVKIFELSHGHTLFVLLRD